MNKRRSPKAPSPKTKVPKARPTRTRRNASITDLAAARAGRGEAARAAPRPRQSPSGKCGSWACSPTPIKLADAATDDALTEVTAPLRARLKRHPKLRAEMLPDFAREYQRLIPTQFRIGKTEGVKDRTSFVIVERRLCGSWLTDDRWTEGARLAALVGRYRERRARLRILHHLRGNT